ncbi:MAG: HAD-IA family hydrolase [Candidatus Electrothrix aestuarii]|uniref:HAD-IA family hydrolase n=1 Tax=Candidatus Electrothrix aestuarii TaxID=3062594 RepID=A0AAU8LQF6_9BACT|nr:HAD-IA family hydrolase [Candidatus Electrothrix aestuarii]
MHQAIIFDFDGTIADSFNSFFVIWNRIAVENGYRVVSAEEIEGFRGKESQDVVRALKIPFLKLPFVLHRARKEFGKIIPEIPLVAGMKETLFELQAQGIQLGLLTSNASENVQAFFTVHQLDCFDILFASSGLWGKARRIEKIITIHQLEKKQVLYVGDETRDIEAARKAGVSIAAVTWGYNNAEVLKNFSPDHLINQPHELLSFMGL